MWWLLACTRVPAPDLPEGDWALTGDGASGMLRVDDGCTIHLSGPGLTTVGPVRCEAHETPGWFVFKLQTAAGEASAIGRWTDDGVVVPLGSREGEFDLVLARSEGQVEVPFVDLATLRESWDAGLFRLEDGGELVGALVVAEQPMIEVYDPFWLSDGPVPALPGERGPDLLLEFDAEPTISGERMLLLVNRPLFEAVVPSGNEASGRDRRLDLVPGVVTQDERTAAIAKAIAAADALEADRMQNVLDGLAGTLAPPCPSTVPQQHARLFMGYTVTLDEADGACVVAIEPDPAQHRRRFRGTSATR